MPGNEWGEVLDIAEGLPRAECERRAYQAFDFANEIRARYTSLLDGAKRSAAISQALAWVSVLSFLEDSSADTFTLDAYLEEKPSKWHRLFEVINPWFWYENVSWSLRAAFGTKPLEFYPPQKGEEKTE